MAGEDSVSIPQDNKTNLSFVFKDGKKFPISEHFFKLSGFIRDIPEDMHKDGPADFPIDDFPSESFVILSDLLDNIKAHDKKAYAAALNGETSDSELPEPTKNFFDQHDKSDLINTANFCTFLSMNFPKKYFVAYYAAFIKNENDIDEITKAIGAEPLTKEDLEAYDIANEPALWTSYPKLYEQIMGHAYREK